MLIEFILIVDRLHKKVYHQLPDAVHYPKISNSIILR
jgi:hypothetical protein